MVYQAAGLYQQGKSPGAEANMAKMLGSASQETSATLKISQASP